jgi:hypothetical protein
VEAKQKVRRRRLPEWEEQEADVGLNRVNCLKDILSFINLKANASIVYILSNW